MAKEKPTTDTEIIQPAPVAPAPTPADSVAQNFSAAPDAAALERKILQLQGQLDAAAAEKAASDAAAQRAADEAAKLRIRLGEQNLSALPPLGPDAREVSQSFTLPHSSAAHGKHVKAGDVVTTEGTAKDIEEMQRFISSTGSKAAVYKVTPEILEELKSSNLLRA